MTESASGRDRYARIYERNVDVEAAWLAIGARHKVDSIQQLLMLGGVRARSLVELGCGPGAVIAECQRRSLAANFCGIDFSPVAVAFGRLHHPGILFEQRDITNSEPGHEVADVVVVTHVVEHLEHPETVLSKLRNFGRYAVIEVPLEDLLASRVKNRFRDRRGNSAGHVAWFTPSSFRSLLREQPGVRIVAERIYVPSLRFRDIWTFHGWSFAARLKMSLTGNLLPRLLHPLWRRLYLANHAVLCEIE